jgi:hypothetical protein
MPPDFSAAAATPANRNAAASTPALSASVRLPYLPTDPIIF